jgi:hypothetical protein
MLYATYGVCSLSVMTLSERTTLKSIVAGKMSIFKKTSHTHGLTLRPHTRLWHLPNTVDTLDRDQYVSRHTPCIVHTIIAPPLNLHLFTCDLTPTSIIIQSGHKIAAIPCSVPHQLCTILHLNTLPASTFYIRIFSYHTKRTLVNVSNKWAKYVFVRIKIQRGTGKIVFTLTCRRKMIKWDSHAPSATIYLTL